MEETDRRAANTGPGSARPRPGVRTAAVLALVVPALAILVLGASLTRSSSAPQGAESGARATGAGIRAPRAARPLRPVLPAPPPTRRLTVAASGDFLMHSPVLARALANGDGETYDFRPMFAEIKPFIEQADLAVCHVETPMAKGPPSGYPRFNTPRALADAIESAGWDACTTASNHALDQGETGLAQTHRTLERAGLDHTGTATARADGAEPLILDVQGVKIALLAYTESTNGLPVPDPWTVNLMDAGAILEDARAARRAGAQAVLVSLHAGTEYAHEPSRTQRRVVRRLTRSPAVTAVIGQHVHVVQPIERVNGKVVVYGEGNLVSNQTAACCAPGAQDGLVALLVLTVGGGGDVRVERVRYVPVHVRRPDYAVLPVGEALEDGEGDTAALRASYRRTVEVVGRAEDISPLPDELP